MQSPEWRGVTWHPDTAEIERAIAHGLRWDGRRRARDTRDMIAKVAAEEIYAQLQADGFLFRRRPPAPMRNGWAGTGPFARLEHIKNDRHNAHCRACRHERELDIASLIAQGWGETLIRELPLV